MQDLSQAETSSLTFNSGQLDRVFESILGESYEVNDLSLQQGLDVCDVADCDAQTVPEASSVLGVLSIGFIALGIAMKRKFFGRQGTTIAANNGACTGRFFSRVR